MATRTVSVLGGGWGTTTTWVENAVPTNADDVVNTATSGAVTVDSANCICKSLDFSSKTTQSFTLQGGNKLVVATGNFILPTGWTGTWASTGIVELQGSGTCTTNARAGAQAGQLNINASGKYTMGSNMYGLTVQQGVIVTSGELDTAGYQMDWGYFSMTGNTTRKLWLGASTINLYAAACWAVNGSNYSLSCGTSSIVWAGVISGAPAFAGGGLVYYNYSVNSTFATNATITDSGNTFDTLSWVATSSGTSGISITGNLSITTNLNLVGFNANINRMQFVSSLADVITYITFGNSATVTGGNFDLKNIATNRSFNISALAGGTTGDSGNNTFGTGTWTFTPAANLWWKGGTAGWATSAALWSATSGGAANTGRFPLPQDTAIFTNYAAGYTVSLNFARMCSISSTDSGARTFSLGSCSTYGSMDFSGSATAISNAGTINLLGGGSNTLTFKAAFTGGLALNSGYGRYTLASAASMLTFTLNSGEFATAGYTMTCSSNFASSTTFYRRFYGGASTIAMTSATVVAFGFANQTKLYVDMQGTSITMATNSNARTFNGGSFDYGNLTVGNGGSLAMVGNNSFHNVAVGSAINFALQATVTRIYGTFTDAGYAGNLTSVYGSGAGATLIKPYGTVTCDYLAISNMKVTGGAYWISGANSTGGNAAGWDNTRAVASIQNPMMMVA